MKYFIWLAVLLSGCGIQKMAEETRDGVLESNKKQDQLLQKMGVTNNGVHLQILTIALQQMRSPENTKNLLPPALMMPYAHTFTEEATPYEITETIFTFLTDAKEYGSNIESPTEAQKAEISHEKMKSYVAAGLLSIFMSEEKYQEIVKTEILSKGRFEETAYELSFLRLSLSKDFLFESVLKTKKLNPGALAKASQYFGSMRRVLDSPYADKFKLTVEGLDFATSIKREDYIDLGETAKKRFERDLDDEAKKNTKVQEQLRSLIIPRSGK